MMNAAWHDMNVMPKRATHDERLHWHAEHVKHCNCRLPGPELMAELIAKGLIEAKNDNSRGSS